jgi:hypothetical protein
VFRGAIAAAAGVVLASPGIRFRVRRILLSRAVSVDFVAAVHHVAAVSVDGFTVVLFAISARLVAQDTTRRPRFDGRLLQVLKGWRMKVVKLKVEESFRLKGAVAAGTDACRGE